MFVPETSTCVRRFLDLSTGHLSPETRELLGDGDSPVPCMTGEYGWFVWVPDKEGLRGTLEDCPADLRAVLVYARGLRCDWVMFDADAPGVDDLPWYDDD